MADLNIDEAVERACDGAGSLIDALTWICIWESERVVKQARANKTWETCFGRCISLTMKKWEEKHG